MSPRVSIIRDVGRGKFNKVLEPLILPSFRVGAGPAAPTVELLPPITIPGAIVELFKNARVPLDRDFLQIKWQAPVQLHFPIVDHDIRGRRFNCAPRAPENLQILYPAGEGDF